MYKNQVVAVVIPAYNESLLIEGVIGALPDFVDHVVVIDDHSRDNTYDVVKTLADQQPDKVILLQTKTNLGCGGALAEGYKWCAVRGDIDIVVRVDGDGQMDPKDMSRLLDPIIDDGFDYTKGNRLITGEAFQIIPKVRYFGNALLSFFTKIASGYWHIADSQSGYTAINKKALQRMNWDEMYKQYGQPNDLLVRLSVYGFKVQDVMVRPVYNVGETSHMRIRVVTFTITLLLLRLFVWRLKEKYIIRDFHPLIFFYLMGFMLLAVSVILFIKAIMYKISMGLFPPITLLAWMFSVSMGFQSLFFAMWFDMDYHRR